MLTKRFKYSISWSLFTHFWQHIVALITSNYCVLICMPKKDGRTINANKTTTLMPLSLLWYSSLLKTLWKSQFTFMCYSMLLLLKWNCFQLHRNLWNCKTLILYYVVNEYNSKTPPLGGLTLYLLVFLNIQSNRNALIHIIMLQYTI